MSQQSNTKADDELLQKLEAEKAARAQLEIEMNHQMKVRQRDTPIAQPTVTVSSQVARGLLDSKAQRLRVEESLHESRIAEVQQDVDDWQCAASECLALCESFVSDNLTLDAAIIDVAAAFERQVHALVDEAEKMNRKLACFRFEEQCDDGARSVSRRSWRVPVT